MLNQPTFEKLVHMRLSAMALAFRQQSEDPGITNLNLEVRFNVRKPHCEFDIER